MSNAFNEIGNRMAKDAQARLTLEHLQGALDNAAEFTYEERLEVDESKPLDQRTAADQTGFVTVTLRLDMRKHFGIQRG